VEGSNEILGGYNPIEWKSDENYSYSTTKDSFIFSFKDSDRIENYVLSRVKNEKEAVYNDPYSGPCFGRSDLAIWYYNHNCYCAENSYEKPIRKTETNFSTEECEVFQVVQDQ
jgi:hypothetical protein